MDAFFAYITVPGPEEARRIGKALLEERLAACVNILPGMESLYWWEGKLEGASEAVLIAKTRPDLREALSAKVVEMHPYDCPCVAFLPAQKGNPAYFDWINRETRHA